MEQVVDAVARAVKRWPIVFYNDWYPVGFLILEKIGKSNGNCKLILNRR